MRQPCLCPCLCPCHPMPPHHIAAHQERQGKTSQVKRRHRTTPNPEPKHIPQSSSTTNPLNPQIVFSRPIIHPKKLKDPPTHPLSVRPCITHPISTPRCKTPLFVLRKPSLGLPITRQLHYITSLPHYNKTHHKYPTKHIQTERYKERHNSPAKHNNSRSFTIHPYIHTRPPSQSAQWQARSSERGWAPDQQQPAATSSKHASPILIHLFIRLRPKAVPIQSNIIITQRRRRRRKEKKCKCMQRCQAKCDIGDDDDENG